MRRTRHGPALFELLEEQSSLFKPLGDKLRQASRRLRSKTPEQPVSRPDAPQPRAVPDSIVTGDSWLALEGDRVRLTFSSLAAAVVLFLFSLSLLLAFGWGVRRGEIRGLQRGLAAQSQSTDTTKQDEISAIKEHKPSTELIRDIAAGTSGPALQAANSNRDTKSPAPKESQAHAALPEQVQPAWVKDRTYIVAQEMPASALESAQAAKEFLARGGIQTAIVKPNDRTLFLVTTHGYNHKDGAEKHQSEQLLDRIRALGTEYYSAGGGYKLEGYYRTLKRDAW